MSRALLRAPIKDALPRVAPTKLIQTREGEGYLVLHGYVRAAQHGYCLN